MQWLSFTPNTGLSRPILEVNQLWTYIQLYELSDCLLSNIAAILPWQNMVTTEHFLRNWKCINALNVFKCLVYVFPETCKYNYVTHSHLVHSNVQSQQRFRGKKKKKLKLWKNILITIKGQRKWGCLTIAKNAIGRAVNWNVCMQLTKFQCSVGGNAGCTVENDASWNAWQGHAPSAPARDKSTCLLLRTVL